VLAQSIGNGRHRLTSAFLLVRRQLLELLVVQQLAVSDRRDRETVWRADEAHVLPPRVLLQGLERCAMTILELLVDLRDAVAVVLALERGRNRLAELVDETLHVLAQRSAVPGREAQRERLALFVEVEDVAPIGRLGRFRRPLAKKLLDDCVAVTSGGAEHEDVE